MCSVLTSVPTGAGEERFPSVKAVDDKLLVYLKLVEMGLGSLAQVRELDSRTVLQALAYQKFKSDYQRAYIYLNSKRD